MTTSRMVIRGSYCQAKPNININIKGAILPGFASPWVVVALLLVIAGFYIYCINSSATKGYQMRQVETEITDLEKENEQLRIKEAELKSLYRIEESSKSLNMAEPAEISYIEEKGPVAMK